MDKNTQPQSFSIDADMAASLDPIATRNIALHYALRNQHADAWRLMTNSKKLKDFLQIIHKIEDSAEHYNLTAEQAQDVILGFAPLIGRQLALQNHERLEEPEKLIHGNTWFGMQEKFVRAMASAAGNEELIASFCNNLPSGIQSKGSHHWKNFHDAFDAIPCLLENAVKACSKLPTQPGKTIRHGSPGLLLATSRGNLSEFKRCLAALESIGADPALCVAQMWPDNDQRKLPYPYNENCTLTDAMAAGSLDIAQYIISVNPTLSPMMEAERIAIICNLLDQENGNPPDLDYGFLKAQALSIAEALTLNSSVQGATSKSKAKPL